MRPALRAANIHTASRGCRRASGFPLMKGARNHRAARRRREGARIISPTVLKAPVRILLVSPGDGGGAERTLARLASHLPAGGFRPAAVLLGPGPLEAWLSDAGCDPVVVADPGQDVSDLCRDVIRAEGARILVSNKWSAHVHGGPAALAERIPGVWWQHDVARDTPAQLEAAAIPAAAIVCCSDYTASALRATVPDARFVTVYSGVPVRAIAAHAGGGAGIRRSLGWEEAPIAGIVGRLQEWKAQHVFLRAAALVAQRDPRVRFLVVGGAILGTEGPYPEKLARLTDELGLGEVLHFAGHQDDVWPWFDALDVVVNATDGEPFPLVVVEAMALGKPVVAMDVGGPRESIEPGVSGLLAAPEQPPAMAEAILDILGDPELAQRLGVGGRRRAEQFTEERMSDEFVAVLRSLE